MLVNFLIHYKSQPGENLFLKIFEKANQAPIEIKLSWKDEAHWQVSMDTSHFSVKNMLQYEIFLTKDYTEEQLVLIKDSLEFSKLPFNEILVEQKPFIEKRYPVLGDLKPFRKVFKVKHKDTVKNSAPEKTTHIFKVSYPYLQKNYYLCLTGSGEKLNHFNAASPLLFKKKKGAQSYMRLNLSKENFPLQYKLGIYDSTLKTIVAYEPGENNSLNAQPNPNAVHIIGSTINVDQFIWKAAGINIPVFSIRTAQSWGSGDFYDLHLMVDYAASVGLKLIQLLPVNDTTSTLFDKDSYPYSAISSFALHPKLLSVSKMIQHYIMEVTDDETAEVIRLNSLPTCDHAGVINLKFSVLRRIFANVKNDFTTDKKWESFFELNNEWLVPYAVFCVLRDKFGTLNFDEWGAYELPTQEVLAECTEPTSDFYDEVLFWYFLQFHLHIQLKTASSHAHKMGVILKADLPIGVGRYSVDTWVNPQLFNMNMQAGAPPDAFSTQGQNWSFPTYNIGNMAADNFDWFNKRMRQLEKYFDAVRIDHVLGLFRIWSIPANQIHGTMGMFVPAVPIHKNEFYAEGINFDENRLCRPYVTEEALHHFFGEDTAAIKNIFFDDYQFKPEFDDQRKIAYYLHIFSDFKKYEEALFDLQANVILFKDAINADGYHFRINVKQTDSYNRLSEHEKHVIGNLYTRYFYEMQNDLWKKEGIIKLEMFKKATKMLLCAEDLGMVPDFTEEVLHSLDILSLQVQQMPKDVNTLFSDTKMANYESVVMPATHDMPPMRLWWEQNRSLSQLFYTTVMQEFGDAPYFCEPWVCKKIIEEHLQSPAMWSIFLIQDFLAMDAGVRIENPTHERINDPSNGDNVWNYRMHLTIEELMKHNDFNNTVKYMIKTNGR